MKKILILGFIVAFGSVAVNFGDEGKWEAISKRLARELMEQSPGWKIATEASLFGDAFAKEMALAIKENAEREYDRSVPEDHQPTLGSIEKQFSVHVSDIIGWRIESLKATIYFHFYGRFGFGVAGQPFQNDPDQKIILIHIRAPGDWGKAIDNYRDLKNSEINSEKAQVERLYEQACLVQNELLENFDGTNLLEWLPDPEYQQLVQDLPEFCLNRIEVIIANPKPTFFLDLSSKKGRQVDQTFFGEMIKTYDDCGWPQYLQRQTDYGGCTEFEKGELVRNYRSWNLFRGSSGGAYEKSVSDILRNIEFEIAEGTCSCNDAEATLKELERFLSEFPNSSIANQVRQRVAEIKNGTSKIRFKCSPA